MSVQSDVSAIKQLLKGDLGVVETLKDLRETNRAIQQHLAETDAAVAAAQATADQAKDIAMAGNARMWRGLLLMVVAAVSIAIDFALRRT